MKNLLVLAALAFFGGCLLGVDATEIEISHGSLTINGKVIKLDALPAELCSEHFPGMPVRIYKAANEFHHVDEAGISFMRYGSNGSLLHIEFLLDTTKRMAHHPMIPYRGDIICNGMKLNGGDIDKWIKAEKIEPFESGKDWNTYWAKFGDWEVFLENKGGSFASLVFQASTSPPPTVP